MNQDEFREVPLEGGHTVTVHKGDYPIVREWDWSLDKETGLATRLFQGRKVRLYHELLRRHRNTDHFVALGEDALETLFSKYEPYEKLIEEWATREETVDFDLPDPIDLLAYSLTSALYLYHDWLKEGKEYTFHADAESLGPGSIFRRKRRGVHRYDTLGDWMFCELTGEWTEDEDSPTGVVPQDYADAVAEVSVMTFISLLEESSPGVDPEQVWADFEERELSLDYLIKHVHELLRTYPISAEF